MVDEPQKLLHFVRVLERPHPAIQQEGQGHAEKEDIRAAVPPAGTHSLSLPFTPGTAVQPAAGLEHSAHAAYLAGALAKEVQDLNCAASRCSVLGMDSCGQVMLQQPLGWLILGGHTGH